MKKLAVSLLALAPFYCAADFDVMGKLYMAENSSPAEGTGEGEKTFTMDGELGVIVTSGNTDTKSLKGKINAHQELENWSNDYILEALYKQDKVSVSDSTETKTTAQKLFASAQGSYKLENPDHRLFLFGSYEDDRFSGYQYQATLAGGWGQLVWRDDVSHFSYSVGPGYSFAKTDGDEDRGGFIVRGAADYQRKISDTSTFRQLISTEVGADNTKSKSETSLSAKINGSLAMKISLILNHNTDVAEDKENLDTETAVTLVYTFF